MGRKLFPRTSLPFSDKQCQGSGSRTLCNATPTFEPIIIRRRSSSPIFQSTRQNATPTSMRRARSFHPPHSHRADPDLHSEQIGRAIDGVLRRRLVHDTERIADFHFFEHRGDLTLRLRDRHAGLDHITRLRNWFPLSHCNFL